MDGKVNISDYRHRLDKTLTSPDLTNDDMLQILVKNQMLNSSNFQVEECENVVERRSKEVSNFLSMLRSASENDSEREESNGGWKVKQDTEELRVMYREGSEGTPFHTLLAEGYVDGPVDICLCISFESELYKEWWPRTAIPTFKVVSSQCLKRVRIGEQISLVRMKVSWPLSSREALIHYFVFEYFQDGLIVVVLNSISDSEILDKSTHGFTRDGIPDAQDVVRIDVVGGFAIQKVTAERSFFRTIATLDIKLDFVPPAFINFISRQLIGSGFKLYEKEVASVSKGDKIYAKALKEPLYAHVREALYSENKSTVITVLNGESLDEIEEIKESENDTNQSTDVKFTCNEITQTFRAEKNKVGFSTGAEMIHDNGGNFGNEVKKKAVISSEVEQALGMLEKVISVFREYNIKPATKVQSVIEKGNLKNIEIGFVEESLSSQDDEMIRENRNCAESAKIESTEVISNEPKNSSAGQSSRCRSYFTNSNFINARNRGSNSSVRETNQSMIIPASPDGNMCSPSQTASIVKHSSVNTTNDSIILAKIDIPQRSDANSIREDGMTKRKHKNSWFCCLCIKSGQ